MAVITNLAMHIHSAYSGKGMNAARRDLRRLERATDRINALNRAISDAGMNALKAAALAAAPALIAVGQQALFVAGALTAMAASAGTAGGAYVGVMIAASKRAFELKEANKKLNKSQREHVQSVNALKKAWNKFLDSKTGSRTLVPLNIAIKAITRNMGKLKPLINAVHPIIRKVARAFASWMDRSDGFKRFIDVIKKHGVPALRNLMKAGRRVLDFLGDGFRAFAPEGRKMSRIILDGAKALNKWSNQGGFQRFIKSTKKNGPQVRELFRSLGPAVKQLSKALVGMVPAALQLATAFARIVANTPVPVLQAFLYALIALRTVLAIAGMIRILAGAFVALKLACTVAAAGLRMVRGAAIGTRIALIALWVAALGPVGLIIAGIVAVVAAIVLIARRTRWFQNIWKVVWAGIKAIAKGAWAVIKAIWRAMRAGWSFLGKVVRAVWRNVIRPVFNLFKKAVRGWWNIIKGIFKLFRAAWRFLGRVVRAVWRNVIRPVWNIMKKVWKGVWGVLKRLWKALRSAWRFVGRVIRAVWRGTIRVVWNTMKKAWRGVWGVLKRLWKALRSAWKFVGGVIRSVWRGTIRVAWNTMRAVWRGVWNFLKARWKEMRKAWSFAGNVIRAIWRNVIRPAFNAVKEGVNLVKKAFDKAKNGIKAAWSKIRDIVKGPIKFFIETVYNGGIRKGWNATFAKLPVITELPKMPSPFARGGPIKGPGGPTADKVPILASSGEYMIRAAAVKRLGVPLLDKLNASSGNLASPGMGMGSRDLGTKTGIGRQAFRPIGGYSMGGLIANTSERMGSILKGLIGTVVKIAKGSDFLGGGGGFLGQLIDNLVPGTDDTSAAFSWASGFFKDIAKAAARAFFKPFQHLLDRIGPNNAGGGMFNKVPGEYLDSIIPKLIEWIFANSAEGGMFGPNVAKAQSWARKQSGKPYRLGSFGSAFDCSTYQSGIARIVSGQSPSPWFTTHPFHSGRKNVLAFQKGLPSGHMMGITAAGIGHTGGTIGGMDAEATPPRVITGGRARGASHPMFRHKYGHKKGVGGPGSFGGRWAQMVAAILKEKGLSQSHVGNVMRSINQESGGNPNARNNWDSNAAAGMASRGLNQVIPPTFNAYAGKYRKLGIMNPYANVYASIQYARARYGANWSNRMAAPGGYAGGGLVPTFDGGGWLGPGLNLVNNATGHAEPSGNQMRDEYNFHFHGPVWSGSEKEFTEKVIKAMSNAKRKGRTP